jgi:hypothetical protein
LPGLHITDPQMRLYMSYRQTQDAAVAAAKAGFGTATGSRMIHACPRLVRGNNQDRQIERHRYPLSTRFRLISRDFSNIGPTVRTPC